MRSYRFRRNLGRALTWMTWASLIVLIVSSWAMVSLGPENSRVDFFSWSSFDILGLEGRDELYASPLNPPYDFALADSVLTVNIEFLEQHQLTEGPVSVLGNHGDLSKYYQELTELRTQVNALAIDYPDSASGNNVNNEEFKDLAKPVMSSIVNFDSEFLLVHAVQGSLRSWSIAFMASMLLFIYGLICWKQNRCY